VPFLLAISNCMNRAHFFSGYTLVDITNTGVTRDRGTQVHERNQQRNWETVLQCISIRSQPMNIVCKSDVLDLDYLEFGEMYKGKQRVWSFAFTVEHEDVFSKDGDPLLLLHESFDQVPVICGLDETARFMLPIFWTAGAIKNIYFKLESFE